MFAFDGGMTQEHADTGVGIVGLGSLVICTVICVSTYSWRMDAPTARNKYLYI